MNEVKEYFKFLVEEVHSTVFATIDENGNPSASVIDLMLYDDEALYFLTAKGKNFYNRIMKNKVISLSGMSGRDTMSTRAVSITADIENIGTDKLDEIFEKNPYMNEIYTTEKSKMALEVFKIYKGRGEFIDLSVKPIVEKSFAFGGEEVLDNGYVINDKCIECNKCFEVCSFSAIKKGSPYKIVSEYCLKCGNCMSVCDAGAVVRF